VEQASGVMPILPKTKPMRLFRDQAHVHGQRHGRADADRRAVDGGDHRFLAIENGQCDAAAGVAHAAWIMSGSSSLSCMSLSVGLQGFIQPEHIAACRQVHAGAEGAPGAGDDDGAHVIVIAGAVEGVTSSLAISTVKAVELLGRLRVRVRMRSAMS
jgi:hypothetical protein